MNNTSLVTNGTFGIDGVWQRYPSLQLLLDEFRPGINDMRMVLPIVWLVIGIPGNCLAIFTWTRPRLRSSSGFFLAAVAISDLGNQLVRLLFLIGRASGVAIFGAPVVCQLSAVTFTSFQYNHVLLVTAFSVERYLVIRDPLNSRSLDRERHTKRHIALLVAVSTCVALVQAYFYTYDSFRGCTLRESVKRGGVWSVFSVWSWTSELLFFGALPVGVLVINSLLIRIIARRDTSSVFASSTSSRKTDEEQPMSVAGSSCRSETKRKRSHVKNVTLLCVSFYTILCELPVTIVHCLEESIQPGDYGSTDAQIRNDAAWQSFLDYRATRYIVENIAASHYAVGFYISLATMETFRQELKRGLTSRRV